MVIGNRKWYPPTGFYYLSEIFSIRIRIAANRILLVCYPDLTIIACVSNDKNIENWYPLIKDSYPYPRNLIYLICSRYLRPWWQPWWLQPIILKNNEQTHQKWNQLSSSICCELLSLAFCPSFHSFFGLFSVFLLFLQLFWLSQYYERHLTKRSPTVQAWR